MFRQSWSPHYGSRRPRWVPTVVASSPSNINANTDALVITERAATVAQGFQIAATSAALVITERVAAANLARAIAARLDRLAIDGGWSLRFYGNDDGNGTTFIDRVRVDLDDDPPANIGAGDFTVEMWLLAESANAAGSITPGANNNWINGNVFFDRDRFGVVRAWGASLGAGRVAFGVRDSNDTFRTIVGTTDIRDGQWHHVALVRDISATEISIYVDGVREATSTSAGSGSLSYPPGASTSYPNSDPYMVFGAEKHDAGPGTYPSFYGYIEEVRLSNTERYTGTSFTPPTGRLELDADTVALYRFNEGTGTTVTDENGNQSPGTLSVGGAASGPTWQRVSHMRRRAALNFGRNVTTVADSLVLTERVAGVGLARTIAAGFDALVLTEQTGLVSLGREIVTVADSLTITEQTAAISRLFAIAAAADALLITERQASVNQGAVVDATADALVIAEQAAIVNAGRNILATTDALLISELAGSLGQGTNLSAGTDTLTLTERTASLAFARNLAATVASLILTERQANVNLARTLAATADSLGITERAAAVALGVTIAAEADALTITERAAVVSGVSAVIEVAAARLVRLAASNRTVRLAAGNRTITLH